MGFNLYSLCSSSPLFWHAQGSANLGTLSPTVSPIVCFQFFFQVSPTRNIGTLFATVSSTCLQTCLPLCFALCLPPCLPLVCQLVSHRVLHRVSHTEPWNLFCRFVSQLVSHCMSHCVSEHFFVNSNPTMADQKSWSTLIRLDCYSKIVVKT